jgi:hypothetical protein
MVFKEVQEIFQKKFLQPIRKEYPDAKIVINEIGETYTNYYYDKKSMLRYGEQKESGWICICEESLDHFKQLLKEAIDLNTENYCYSLQRTLLSQSNEILSLLIHMLKDKYLNNMEELMRSKVRDSIELLTNKLNNYFIDGVANDISNLCTKFIQKHEKWTEELSFSFLSFLLPKLNSLMKSTVMEIVESKLRDLEKDFINSIAANPLFQGSLNTQHPKTVALNFGISIGLSFLEPNLSFKRMDIWNDEVKAEIIKTIKLALNPNQLVEKAIDCIKIYEKSVITDARLLFVRNVQEELNQTFPQFYDALSKKIEAIKFLRTYSLK